MSFTTSDWYFKAKNWFQSLEVDMLALTIEFYPYRLIFLAQMAPHEKKHENDFYRTTNQ